LIKTLENYHTKLPTNPLLTNEHLSELDKQSIERNYLRGVPLKNLALQFNQSIALIEMVLRNRGIEIVDNALPKNILFLEERSIQTMTTFLFFIAFTPTSPECQFAHSCHCFVLTGSKGIQVALLFTSL